MIPNLFVIGASKAGTTSLHGYLALHPEIVMSTVKEPGYFLDEVHREPCVTPQPGSGDDPFDLYLRLFPGLQGKKYAGEATPGYTWLPHRPGIAERLHRFNPDARLIYLIRDPIERTISHYWYWCLMGTESRPPLAAIRQNPLYCDVSNYPLQLREYLRIFPREQIYVMTLDDLTGEPAPTMAALFEWLELDPPPGHSDECYSQRKNETPGVIIQPRGLSAHIRNSRLFRRVRRFIPQKLRQYTWQLIGNRRVARSQTDMTETVAFLREVHGPEVRELEELLGRSFSHWHTPQESAVLVPAG